MKKLTVSKCGARWNKPQAVQAILKEPKEEKPEKKTIPKRTYRKVTEKLGDDFPVDIEDEN